MKSMLPLLAAALLLAGCGPKLVKTPIHRDGRVTVWLEHRLDESGRPIDAGHRHPASLPAIDAGTVLQSLQVRRAAGVIERLLDPKRTEIEPVFTPDEADLLAGPIAQALAAATPADRVNFRFEHRRGLFRGGLTTGTLFVTGDRLQVVLGMYRQNVPPDINESRERLDDPLDTRDSAPFKLVAGPFQEAAADAPQPLRDRAVAIDYPGLLTAQSEDGRAPADSRSLRSPAPPAAPTEDSGDLEQRLRTLKRLRDQDLITDEEYQRKKTELLRQF